MGTKQSLKPSDFVHLHNHTQYSLLDGLTKIPQLVERVKELGMESCAISDHGTLSGAIEFYKEANGNSVNPIIGMEAYVAARSHLDKDAAKDRQIFHLTILAMNQQGYKNLMQLTTIANLEGFYYKPRIDRELLKKYNEGLIILSGCMGGELSDSLRQNDHQLARETVEWYKKTFGDRYYIELMDHGHPDHPAAWAEQVKVNDELLKLSKEFNIPAVVTSDAHYLMHEDKEAHEILLCVQTGSYFDDKDRFSLNEFELFVADPKDLIKRWGDKNPELILNTKKIAERCKLNIELGEILIPKFPTPKGETEKSLLEKEVWSGLLWRYSNTPREEAEKKSNDEIKKKLPKEVVQRAEYEMDIVNSMGFNGYFLIVSDFINWGKNNGIVFGPGRGSAASSIMAYAMRITEIDPLKYDLLFERFLNPERISMPDMDIDIQDTRRDEVINYCVEKYGHDRVANIVTFGRMAARNSVRDVARVLQVPYSEADRLAKMIPPPVQGRHTPLKNHLEQVPELAEEYASNAQAAKVFDLAIRLEGTIRSHGVHAAGVVIAPDKIVEFVPLELAQKGVVATQYSMGPVENLGLLKMDFLGLSNLTIIKNTLRIIKRVENIDIDINTIPLDDRKTFKLLQKGDTTSVFQLESAGMRRYLKQLKPTTFEDIVAMVALYRPGPMQWIDDFIARKNGQKRITYIHPVMKNALENTYGVIVYQEQMMQISKDLCGFSGGQADALRQAIAKKVPEKLAKLKSDFIEGAIKHSKADRKLMEKFWDQLEDFAAYCFNKVHSACYGLIAYQTAYLKANYPEAYMAAVLTSDYDDTDSLAIEIAECRRMGIDVLAPSINESFHEFAVVPGERQIRFGLDAIKNVGHGAVSEILRARDELGGLFESFEQYCQHVDNHIVNKKALESLIKAGVFDKFYDRSLLLNNIENILAYSTKIQRDERIGQVDLFSGDETSSLGIPLNLDKSGPQFSENEQLKWERDLLGVYLSSHPLNDYQSLLKRHSVPTSLLDTSRDGSQVVIGGIISGKREIVTKSGSKMAFVRVSDMYGDIEVIIFPNVFSKLEIVLDTDKIILANGKIDKSGRGGVGETKIIADQVIELDLDNKENIKLLKSSFTSPNLETKKQKLYIRIQNSDDQVTLSNLKTKLDVYAGTTEVVLVTGPSDSKQAIKLPQAIVINESSMRDLADLFGPTNVIVK